MYLSEEQQPSNSWANWTLTSFRCNYGIAFSAKLRCYCLKTGPQVTHEMFPNDDLFSCVLLSRFTWFHVDDQTPWSVLPTGMVKGRASNGSFLLDSGPSISSNGWECRKRGERGEELGQNIEWRKPCNNQCFFLWHLLSKEIFEKNGTEAAYLYDVEVGVCWSPRDSFL